MVLNVSRVQVLIYYLNYVVIKLEYKSHTFQFIINMV